MRKAILAAALCAFGVRLGARAAMAGDGAQAPKVLLLCHFNRGLDADVAVGDSTAGGTSAQPTSNGGGYRYLNSAPSAEGADLRQKGASLTYALKDNIDLEQGTVSFWVAFRADVTERGFRVLFEVYDGPPNSSHRKRYFWVHKGEKGTKIRARVSDGKRGSGWRCASDAAGWKANEWHHVAMTWSAERPRNQIHLYVDGEFAAKAGPYFPLSDPPERFGLGHPWWGASPYATFDEFVVYDRPLSAGEIKADYEWMKSGKELPRPGVVPKERSELRREQQARQKAAAKEVVVRKEPGEPKQTRRASALRLVETVRLDGKLEEEAWRAAPPLRDFTRKDGSRPEVSSEVRVAYDDEALYVGFRFEEPKMETLLGAHTGRQHGALWSTVNDGAVWSDDCIEVFLDTRAPGGKYHIAMGAGGGIYDARIRDASFNTRTRGCLHKGADFWSGELAIPLADLGTPPLPGAEWGINIGRERRAVPGKLLLSAWQSGAGFFNPTAGHGVLFFGESVSAAASLGVEVKDFGARFFGHNVLRASLTNRTNATLRVVGTISLVAPDETRLARHTATMSVKPDATHVLDLPYTVTDDAARHCVFSLRDEQARSTLLVRRRPLVFEPMPAGASIRALRDELDGYRLLSRRLNPTHHLAKEAKARIGKVVSSIASFDRQVAEALKKQTVLKPAVWEAVRQQAASFHGWRKQNSVLLWRRDPWERVEKGDLPREASPRAEIRVSLSQGELESAALMVTNLLVPEGLDLRILPGDLKEQGSGRELSHERIRVREVVFVTTASKEITANALAENQINRVVVPPGESRQVWLTIDARGMEPGIYKGTIRVKPLDLLHGQPRPWREVPLEVTVWDFALPSTGDNPLDVFLWSGLTWPSRGWAMGNASPGVRADDLEEHRVNVAMGTSNMDGWAPAKKKGADGKWHLDYTFDDAFLLELKRRSMKVMYSWGGPGSFGPDHILAASEHFLEIGLTYDDFCFQAGPDEFFPKDVPKMVERGKRYKAEAPGIRFMVDVIPQVGADSIEKLTPYVDVWVPLLSRVYPQTEAAKKRMAVFRNAGGKLWAYDCATWMNVQPLMDYYRLKPWKAWKVGLDGIAYWTYNSWQGDGFDPFDNKRHKKAGDNGMIYQGARKDVVVSSKHYEALREGIEDYCYLHLLKQAVETGKKRGKPTGEAEALLSRCVDDVLANTNDPGLIDRYRAALAKEIVRLRN